MRYFKLVRDKIPEYIIAKGGHPTFHVADKKEYWEKLKDKLEEEVSEFKNDESAEEFSDLLEVIEAIKIHKNFDDRNLLEIRKKKADERGLFEKGIILEES